MGTTNLVDHHDRKQVTDCRKEQAVEVVLNTITDGVTKDVQDDLSNNEEEDAKDDVAHGPAVFKRAKNEDNLADEVDEEEDGVHDVCDHEDADGVLGIKTGPVFESEEGNGAADNEHAERSQSQQPDRQGGTVLVQLKSHETVD